MPAHSPHRLRLKYVPLDEVRQWDENPKGHEIDTIQDSIRKYGFKDPPKFEPALNGGDGGIVEGNGRYEALASMRAAGEDPPSGISKDWKIPVLFGVDAQDELEAKAYAIDHNNIVVASGDFSAAEVARLWNLEPYQIILEGLRDADLMPLTVGPSDPLLAPPEPLPSATGETDFGEIETTNLVVCPKCQHRFKP